LEHEHRSRGQHSTGTVTLDPSRFINTIIFNAGVGSYTLSGGSLGFYAGQSIQLNNFTGSGVTETINCPIVMDGDCTVTNLNSTASDILYLGSLATISCLQSLTLNGNNTGPNTIAGIISSQSPSNGTTLYKSGNGTWILSGANTYSGANVPGYPPVYNTTWIEAGTLQVGNGSSTGNLGVGNIEVTSSLVYDRSDIFTENNTIGIASESPTSPGTVSQIGTGTLIFANTNSYSGGTIISAGTLQVGNGNNSGTLGIGGVLDNSALVYDRSDSLSDGNLISGTGTVSQVGGGPTSLINTDSTYLGFTKIDAGILDAAALANGGNPSSLGGSSNIAAHLIFGGGMLRYSGSVAVSTDRLFTIGDASGNTAVLNASGTDAGTVNFSNPGLLVFPNAAVHSLTLTGLSAGANTFVPALADQSVGNPTSLIKAGPGNWIISGANTFTGGVNLGGGTLGLGSAGALGTSGSILFTGGTLQFSAANVTDYSTRFSAASGQLYSLDTNGQSVVLAGNLGSSGGSLTKLGAGTLTLAGNNTYTAATTVAAGRLVMTTSFSTFSSIVISPGATLALGPGVKLGSAGSLTNNGTLDLRNDPSYTLPANFTNNGVVLNPEVVTETPTLPVWGVISLAILLMLAGFGAVPEPRFDGRNPRAFS
jgi:fibronectin-binding autotransporter adhesin